VIPIVVNRLRNINPWRCQRQSLREEFGSCAKSRTWSSRLEATPKSKQASEQTPEVVETKQTVPNDTPSRRMRMANHEAPTSWTLARGEVAVPQLHQTT